MRIPFPTAATPAQMLKRVNKVFQADARLPKNTLKCANNQVAMHWHCDAPNSLGQTNMGAGLSGNREAQPLQGLECFGPRDIPG